MSTTTLETTPINQKKIKKSKAKTGGNNWGAFSVSVLSSFIFTLFVGVLGANFIFLSSIDDNLKEIFFPIKDTSNDDFYFFGGGKSKRGGDGDGGKETETLKKTLFTETKNKNLNSIGIGNKGGWPYNMKNKNLGIFQTFKDWFARIMEGSYKTNRGFLREWLTLFTPATDGSNILANETFKMFFIAPLTLSFTPLVLIFGFIITFISTFESKHPLWSLIGFFSGLSCSISGGVSMLQFIQYFLTFTILPLYSNIGDVKNILAHKANALAYLFGLLICINAFSSLDSITAIVMTIVYALMVIKDLFF